MQIKSKRSFLKKTSIGVQKEKFENKGEEGSLERRAKKTI